MSTINGIEPDSSGNVIISTGGLPVGFEYFQTNPVIRAGSIPLTGGEYSRKLYKDLWEWIRHKLVIYFLKQNGKKKLKLIMELYLFI